MEYTFDATLHEDSESGGAYVIFPWNIRKEFGKGCVKVHEGPEVNYTIGILQSCL